MKYHYSILPDFIADEDFIRWVKYPDQQSNLYWQQWLAVNPGKATLLEEARRVVQQIHFHQDPETPQRVAAIWQRILFSTQAAPAPARTRTLWPAPAAGQMWYKLAAVLTGLLLLSGALLFLLHGNNTQKYQTAFGETRQITLPDGSQVVLNAHSSLRFQKNWKSGREVWLAGEAFFTVRKQPLRQQGRELAKFTVHTSQADVQVLGTEFNISESREDTRVVLHSGKITLRRLAKKDSILMQPGDLVAFGKNQAQVTRKKVNTRVYCSWKDKEWVLENQTLREVAAKIESTYGVKVTFANPQIANATITGVVPTASLTNLLNALSHSLNIKISQSANQVQIRE